MSCSQLSPPLHCNPGQLVSVEEPPAVQTCFHPDRSFLGRPSSTWHWSYFGFAGEMKRSSRTTMLTAHQAVWDECGGLICSSQHRGLRGELAGRIEGCR